MDLCGFHVFLGPGVGGGLARFGTGVGPLNERLLRSIEVWSDLWLDDFDDLMTRSNWRIRGPRLEFQWISSILNDFKWICVDSMDS